MADYDDFLDLLNELLRKASKVASSRAPAGRKRLVKEMAKMVETVRTRDIEDLREELQKADKESRARLNDELRAYNANALMREFIRVIEREGLSEA